MISKLLLMGAATVSGAAIAWVAPAYHADPELGMSRMLAGWNDPRFRTFHRLFLEIELGMTRAQVEQTLDQIYPAAGDRKRPKIMGEPPPTLWMFMDPEHAKEPNCEGIFVTFRDGRVVSKDYSMD